MIDRNRWNCTRFDRSSQAGHYESWFLRANHPEKPHAFWLRYTIFSPKGRPDAAVGELWAIVFDGEVRSVVAVKEEHPMHQCRFSAAALDVAIAGARLTETTLSGAIRSSAHRIAWSLAYDSPQAPLLLVEERMIDRSFPKAKQTTPSPCAVYSGVLEIDGKSLPIDGWVGAQSHNWGAAHTDAYAWCQVAGFDQAPDAYFEAGSARYAFGPIRTPTLTACVLRLDGRDHQMNSVRRAVCAKGRYVPFEWEITSSDGTLHVSAVLSAPSWSFVALPYPNPPGGVKTCLNSKLARCELTVTDGPRVRKLSALHRAAFEILTDDAPPPGVTRLVR